MPADRIAAQDPFGCWALQLLSEKGNDGSEVWMYRQRSGCLEGLKTQTRLPHPDYRRKKRVRRAPENVSRVGGSNDTFPCNAHTSG